MNSSCLLPLEQASQDALAAVRIVLADIDDTLTTDGHLTARAYDALERLAVEGFPVVPVTGRPAGWCDLIARFWPVAGVVGENGALAFSYDRVARRMTRLFAKSDAERTADRARLAKLGEDILATVPGSALAADQPYRIADLAIDYCEDVPALSADAVARIVARFERAGATAKVSSIHVNGWFGNYDKLTMATRLLHEVLQINLAAEGEHALYVGDSPNDMPFFAALPLTVGVANIATFAATMTALPSFITKASGGEGFAELADRLVDARTSALAPTGEGMG